MLWPQTVGSEAGSWERGDQKPGFLTQEHLGMTGKQMSWSDSGIFLSVWTHRYKRHTEKEQVKENERMRERECKGEREPERKRERESLT